MTFVKATVSRAAVHILLSLAFLCYHINFPGQGVLKPSLKGVNAEIIHKEEHMARRRLGKGQRKPKSKKNRSHHADPLVEAENDGIVVYDEVGNADYEPTSNEEDEDNTIHDKFEEDESSLDELLDSFIPRNRINDIVTQNENEGDETKEDEFSLDLPMDKEDQNDKGTNSPQSHRCYGWWWGMKC